MGGLEVREKRMSREEFLIPFEINTDVIESKLNEDAAEIVHPSISDTYIEKKIEDEIVNKSVDRLVTLISKRKAMKDKYGSLLDGE